MILSRDPAAALAAVTDATAATAVSPSEDDLAADSD